MAKALVWVDVRARLSVDPPTLGSAVLPIAFPNAPFTRPQPPAPFLLVEVAAGSGKPIELGGRTWQDEAQVFVHVLVPTNIGVDSANDIEDQVRALFRQPSASGVIYESVDGDPGGPGSEDGVYWRTTIIANCRVQTILES